MKNFLFLLLIFVQSYAVNADSLYPLKCGNYFISSVVKIKSPTSFELIAAPGSFSETRIKINHNELETVGQYILEKEVRLFNRIKIFKKKSPYEFEARVLGKPKISVIEATPDFEQIINLESKNLCDL